MTATIPVNNDFANRLYGSLASTNTGKNLFLSPFSIQVALAMCALGAKGETRQVMAKLIGAPDDTNDQNHQYADLLKSINGDGERSFQLNIANALWGQKGYHFKPDYKEAVNDFYGGAFNEVDFIAHSDNAVNMINSWVSNETHEKIKDLISRESVDADTRLILTNAIYFKGKWNKEFDAKDTKDEDFFAVNGTRKVPMMHQKGGYRYYGNDDFQALDVSYKGDQLTMLIVLPTKRDGLTSLETKLATNGAYQQLTKNLYFEDTVIVSLPRFKLETEFKLKPMLCNMGAELAFSDHADFTGIGEEPLKISEVIHKAFVEVNEEGTEAAAATAVEMRLLASAPSSPIIFKADHPFLFLIRDKKTATIMFSGRLLDPK